MTEVLPINPSPEDMARHIHRLAEDPANIILTKHARERMGERHVTRRHVVACLRKGRITEGPYKDVQKCWRCTMTRAVSGIDVSVAAAVNFEDQVIIVTVF